MIDHRTSRWRLSSTALDSFLAALDADRDAAAERYEQIRSKLLRRCRSLLRRVDGGITYTVLIRGFREQDRIRADERRHDDGSRIESFLVEGLKYFDGGIQERSIGIGLIEAYWKGFPRLQEVWRSVLANQAVYILSKLQEKATLPKHEIVNLRRVIRLLASMEATPDQSDDIKKAAERLSVEQRKEYA